LLQVEQGQLHGHDQPCEGVLEVDGTLFTQFPQSVSDGVDVDVESRGGFARVGSGEQVLAQRSDVFRAVLVVEGLETTDGPLPMISVVIGLLARRRSAAVGQTFSKVAEFCLVCG